MAVIKYKTIQVLMDQFINILIYSNAMKAYGGGGCTDPYFPDLGTSWK
jgi:hypothetical protein